MAFSMSEKKTPTFCQNLCLLLIFLGKTESEENFFKKALDKGGTVWYTIKAKKQGYPSSPYRQRARRVDIFSFLLMVKGRFVVRGFALRDFLFYRATPGIGGIFLLALQEIY